MRRKKLRCAFCDKKADVFIDQIRYQMDATNQPVNINHGQLVYITCQDHGREIKGHTERMFPGRPVAYFIGLEGEAK